MNNMSMEQTPAIPHAQIRSTSSALITRILLAIAALWCLYWFVHAWQYWEDDAYIHLEFARSVAAGKGFAFNGRVVAGDTAPLWVLLLAGAHTLVSDWLIAGKLLTVLAALFGLAGIYSFARRLASQIQPAFEAALFPAAIILLIVVNPYTCYWIFSGMESLAASGLACFAVLAATHHRPSTRNFLAACFLAGIGPLLRPEMFFLSAILGLLLIARLQSFDSGSRLGLFASGLFLTTFPLALWSMYSLHAFGHVLPNTNAAKRASPGDSVVHHLINIYSIGFPLILGGVIVGIVYFILRPNTVRRSAQTALKDALAPVARKSLYGLSDAGWVFILWLVVTTIFYVFNHTYVQTRYILVTAPGVTAIVVALALMASRRIGRIVYATGLAAALFVSLAIARPLVRNKGINCQISRDLAYFIRDHIPPDAPVADYSIGEIAFFSQHPIIDTGGITRPGAIPYLNGPPDKSLAWIRSEGAQYTIGVKPEPGATIAYRSPFKFIGWAYPTSRYSKDELIELWKLPPAPASSQLSESAASPASARR